MCSGPAATAVSKKPCPVWFIPAAIPSLQGQTFGTRWRGSHWSPASLPSCGAALDKRRLNPDRRPLFWEMTLGEGEGVYQTRHVCSRSN